MPLLPLAGQPTPQQVSSNYANVAKYIQYIFKVQYITYHWQMFLGTSPALSRYLPTMQMRPKLYILKVQYITHHWHIQLCKWCRRNSRQRWSPVLVGKIIFATEGEYWPQCQLQALKSYWAALFHPHLHLIYWGRIRIFEAVIQAMHKQLWGTTKTYMKRKDETLSRYDQWSLTITWIFFVVNRQLWRKYKSPILSQHKTLL